MWRGDVEKMEGRTKERPREKTGEREPKDVVVVVFVVVDDKQKGNKRKEKWIAVVHTWVVMGQQQKRISHDSMRCVDYYCYYYISNLLCDNTSCYLYISTLFHSVCACMMMVYCMCSTRDRHPTRTFGWKIGNAAQNNNVIQHRQTQASKYTRTRESGWARLSVSGSALSLVHHPSSVHPPACLRASSLTRPNPSACSHTTLILYIQYVQRACIWRYSRSRSLWAEIAEEALLCGKR